MTANNPSVPALQKAIDKAGSQSALGRSLGHSQALVHKWLKSRNPLKEKHCVRIEELWGVTRQELRPNDWRQCWPELAVAAQTAQA